jgi:hypothetical protein
MINLQKIISVFRFARINKTTTPSTPDNKDNVAMSELDDRCLISIEGADAKK